jgi:hypothetical protein
MSLPIPTKNYCPAENQSKKNSAAAGFFMSADFRPAVIIFGGTKYSSGGGWQVKMQPSVLQRSSAKHSKTKRTPRQALWRFLRSPSYNFLTFLFLPYTRNFFVAGFFAFL